MRDLVSLYAVLKSANDMILPHQISESLASIFSIKGNTIHVCYYLNPKNILRKNNLRKGAGDYASHDVSTYRCCLPALTGFTNLSPRSPQRSKHLASLVSGTKIIVLAQKEFRAL